MHCVLLLEYVNSIPSISALCTLCTLRASTGANNHLTIWHKTITRLWVSSSHFDTVFEHHVSILSGGQALNDRIAFSSGSISIRDVLLFHYYYDNVSYFTLVYTNKFCNAQFICHGPEILLLLFDSFVKCGINDSSRCYLYRILILFSWMKNVCLFPDAC